MTSNIAARAATAGELSKFRAGGDFTRLGLVIQQPETVYTCQIDQTFSTLDGVAELTYDNATGTLGDVLPGMTVYVGSTAGARDKGVLRARKAWGADTAYIGQVSHIQFEDDDWLTVVRAFALWPRDIAQAGGEIRMDYDIPFGSPANGGPIPRIAPIAAVLTLVDGSVTFNPPDPTGSACYDGATVSSYQYAAPGAATTSDMDTSAPEWTYDTPGAYLWSCAVTDDAGRIVTSYRWIFVDPEPVDFELAQNPIGDYQSGYWSFAVTLFEDATTDDICERALVVLYAQKEYYGGVAGSIGKIANYENIECVGWIDGESIERDPDAGTVTFKVLGPGYWFKKMRAFPFELQDTSSAPTSWKQLEELTIDKALAHLLFWTTTAPFVMDCYFTGDTTRKQVIAEPFGSLKAQLEAIAGHSIFAKPQTNNLGQLYVEIDQQVMDTTGRAALPVVMAITSVDYNGALEIQRDTSGKACSLELGGYESYDGVSPVQIASRAPGGNPMAFGEPRSYNNYIFADQDECNRVAGALMAMENNEFEPLDVDFSANNRLIDIAPRMACMLTIVPGDTPRGISLSNARLIPRRVERAWDRDNSVLRTNVTFEFETSGVDGLTYVPPTIADYIPPNLNIDFGDLVGIGLGNFGGFGSVDFPNADLGDWFPDPVPPDVEVECTSNTPNQFNLAWDKAWLIGTDSDLLVARCYFPCIIRSSYLTTTLTLNGFWYGDAKNFYHVYAIKNGVRVLTASVTPGVQENIATFTPGSDTAVDGFEIELESGLGSILDLVAGNAIASGSVSATVFPGTTLPVTVGNGYCIENAGGPYIYDGAGHISYQLGVALDSGHGNLARIGWDDFEGMALVVAWGVSAEAISELYARLYFIPSSPTLYVSVADWVVGDNSGSLGYVLREATIRGRMIALINLVVKNVCTL